MTVADEFSDAFSPAFDGEVLLAVDYEAPCEWPADYSACGGGLPEPLASLPASGVVMFEKMAATYLWNWTGRKYGACPVTIRPCRDNCLEGVNTFNGLGGTGLTGAPWTPVIIDGAWHNIGCGTCGDSCGCGTTESIKLPGPIQSILSIQIDGVILPPTAYRVDNHFFLVRMDGGSWPSCQDIDAPNGEVGTWSITYTRGIPVPSGGQVAAGLLANELAKAACGDKSCGLPQRVQSITRQGVTVAVLDSFDDIDTGHTGIWLIDSWVASVTRRPRNWRVRNPDQRGPRPRITTWPVG